MTRFSLTPTENRIVNEFDQQGILLGLPRLEGEDNESYKRRLLDIFAHRANSTYEGLIFGITRELGLTIDNSIRLWITRDVNGDALYNCPAIVFENTKCYVYSDYTTGEPDYTFDRFEINGGAYTISELITSINNTGIFTASLLSAGRATARAMTIYNQSTIKTITSELLEGKGTVIQLNNFNLIEGTVAVSSSLLTTKVNSRANILESGDYYIDLSLGILYCYEPPEYGSTIRYEAWIDNVIIRTSPIILHNLQSEDFKTKVFQQVLGDDGTYTNGLPSKLGASIINELYSVYGYGFGK